MKPTQLPLYSFQRYCLVVLLCFAATFAVVWQRVIEQPMAFLDIEYPMWLSKMQMIEKGRTGSLVILGDSRALAGLIPSRLGAGVVNLALGGGTPIEAYYATQKLVAAPLPPRAILLSFSLANLARPDYLTLVFWDRNLRFGYLNLAQIDEVRRRSRAVHDDALFGPPSPGDLEARLKEFSYAIRFPSYYFPAMVDARGENRELKNRSMLAHLMANRGQVYVGDALCATDPDPEVGMNGFVPLGILDDYLDRTLALAGNHHIPVYFLAMPHNAASVPLYSPELRQDFNRYLNHLSERYPHFHVLGDPFPVYPPDCFGDSAHMNPKGARLWSDHVVQLLDEAQVEGGPFGPN